MPDLPAGGYTTSYVYRPTIDRTRELFTWCEQRVARDEREGIDDVINDPQLAAAFDELEHELEKAEARGYPSLNAYRQRLRQRGIV